MRDAQQDISLPARPRVGANHRCESVTYEPALRDIAECVSLSTSEI
jgi:hypothetical protein